MNTILLRGLVMSLSIFLAFFALAPAVNASVILEEDFGDAPDSYGTLLGSNGARHTIVPGVYLGLGVDDDPDGLPSPLADGDDLNGLAPDDEDGVVLFSPLFQGDPMASVVVNGCPSGGLLDAWIDFNGNGVFDHTTEHLFGGMSIPLTPGPINWLFFSVSPDAILGSTYARFRLSMQGSLLPIGAASDGEVEDYLVSINAVPIPSAMLLLGFGLVGLVGLRKKLKK